MGATTEAVELTRRRAQKTISELDDESLVFCMYGLLANSENSASFVVGGNTETTAVYARTLWGEIAVRWIPTEVLVPAMKEFFGEEGDDA